MKTVTLQIDDTVYSLLQAIAPNATVEEIITDLLDHAQQGVYRPGSWERDWLSQIFPAYTWTINLEPGDPYGRTNCSPTFVKPKQPR